VRVAGYVAPSCSSAAVSVGHDTAASVPLSCSDGSADTLRVLQGPNHGSLSGITNGSVTYTPSSGYAGTDSFTYTGNDGANDAPTATITLTVAAAGGGPGGGGGPGPGGGSGGGDTTPPILSFLKLTPTAFPAARSGP